MGKIGEMFYSRGGEDDGCYYRSTVNKSRVSKC